MGNSTGNDPIIEINSNSYFSEIFLSLFTVFSNFAFLFPTLIAILNRRLIQFFILLSIGVTSFLYHLCKILPNLCIFSYCTLRNWDHIYAYTSLIVLTIALVEFFITIPLLIQSLLILIIFIFNTIIIYIMGPMSIIQIMFLLFIVFFLIFIIISLGISKINSLLGFNSFKEGFMTLSKRIDKFFYFIGISLILVSLFLFILPSITNTKDLTYSLSHSLWHILSSIAWGFILLSNDVTEINYTG